MTFQITIQKNTILVLLMMIFTLVGYSQCKWDTKAKKKNEINRRDSTTWDKNFLKWI